MKGRVVMKKRLLCVLLFIVAMISLIGGVIVNAHTNSFVPTITAGPSNGTLLSLIDGNIYDVAKNYTPKITEKYYNGTDQYAPKTIEISWECKQEPQYYTLKLAIDRQFLSAQEFVTFDTSITLDSLYSGYHYYYQVVANYEDKTVKSKIFDFETESLPRTISLEGVSNTRDIGGYYTEDGKYRVKQGMVYRGAQLEGITAEAKDDFFAKYGIKTDLDIKGTSASPLGDSVNFISVSGPWYAGDSTGIDTSNESYRTALLTEIKTFANPQNYPIYFHCQIGRDRTGTLAFLINALLGVEKNDLYLDYELSFLSAAGCTGIAPSYFMDSPLSSLYNYINNYSNKETLAEKTEQFMLDLGVTADEIASIREIMLEEVK